MRRPIFQRLTLSQRASSVITASPLEVRGSTPHRQPDRPILLKDLGRVCICPQCGNYAQREAPCYNLTTGQVVQYVRCRQCRLSKNLLE